MFASTELRQLPPFKDNPIVHYLSILLSAVSAFIIISTKDTYLSYLLSNSILRFIGRQSYWVYVWHFPLIALIDGRIGIYWLTACYCCIAMICGYY